MTNKSWEKRWTAYLRQLPANRSKASAQEEIKGDRSRLHAGLNKPISSLITQIRIEKIELNAFLADRYVPGRIFICDCEGMR
jgi:hypothetical protein